MRQTFLDSSVLVRYFVQEPGDQTERATRLLGRVSALKEDVHLSITVVFETVHVLTSFYRVPRIDTAETFRQVLGLKGVVLPEKKVIQQAMQLWVDEPPLSFADCYHLVLTKSLGLGEIYSFDKKMGRYPGVTRIEP